MTSYEAGRNDSAKTREHAEVDVGPWRKAALAYLSLGILPRYDVVKNHSVEFSRGLRALIGGIECFVATRSDEILADVEEARRRLTVVERAGLMGEHERVMRLAQSVQALCDHYETLTGITMCLACDSVKGPASPTARVRSGAAAHVCRQGCPRNAG
ncbi:DUF6415 family natural product biosynthesis protein (plasmid) [Streptomyces sp. NBC_00663]|uniref:DUF6415 family natural product biosynthesis protein n=1 Tax=Streptomyces sp. NBC_00663 TaxID=2975801 RepID=UPI002E34A30C|nr:DUF6415 family natural product biosynthesis protein [Streptomyces sp. NBC_00663]